MIAKLLTEHKLEFLSLKGGCTGSSESTHVKIPHCWKSHALAHFNATVPDRVFCACVGVEFRLNTNQIIARVWNSH